jgi:hypothetical protein
MNRVIANFEDDTMRKHCLLYLFAALACWSCTPEPKKPSAIDFVETQLSHAVAKYRTQLQTAPNPEGILRNIEPDGQARGVRSKDWTSGFYPGNWWLLYEYSQDPAFRQAAEAWTALIEQEQWNAGTHDMGFKIYCSFGQGYRLAPGDHYREVIIQSARTLATRFNPIVGCIRSWDHNRDKWQFPVIIDNMMNLELLFAATRLTNDSSFYHIAVQHANTTLAQHFRPDHSSFHVIDFDTLTGEVRNRHTHQGFSHASAWARGQAWGLYGYTLMFRETRDAQYLTQARHIADFMLGHPNMPANLVPYWDFDAPDIPNAPRDASAAAIMASALLELAGYVPEAAGERYFNAAASVLQNLGSPAYTAALGEFDPFLIKHATGHKPHNSEIDVPIIYGDYYYLEALMRYRALLNKPGEAAARI